MKLTELSEVQEKETAETTQPTKNVVSAKDFVKLTKRALKLGATAFDYSKQKKILNMLLLSKMERKFTLATPSMRII